MSNEIKGIAWLTEDIYAAGAILHEGYLYIW